MAVNLVPFPRLHFFLSGVAPLTDDKTSRYHQWTVPQLYQQLWDGRNLMSAVDHREGRYLSAAITFRGPRISASEVERQSLAVRQKNSSYFVEWIPHNIMTSICSVAAKNHPTSAILIGNSSAITSVISRISNQFTSMFRRKAFLHKYLEHGMDEMEFTEAESNVYDLIEGYVQYGSATADEEEEYEYEATKEEDSASQKSGVSGGKPNV